jgi:hypothetical protein
VASESADRAVASASFAGDRVAGLMWASTSPYEKPLARPGVTLSQSYRAKAVRLSG